MDDLPPPFDPSLLRADGGGIRLLGSHCDGCDATYFPPRETCARCGAATGGAELPDSGPVYAATTSAWPIAGLPVPVTVVQVDIARGLRVQGPAIGPICIGERARLVPLVVTGPDGETSLAFAFAGGDADA